MRVAKAILFVYTYLIPTFSFVFSIQGNSFIREAVLTFSAPFFYVKMNIPCGNMACLTKTYLSTRGDLIF